MRIESCLCSKCYHGHDLKDYMVKKVFQNQNNFWTVVFVIDGKTILAEVGTQEEAELLASHFQEG